MKLTQLNTLQMPTWRWLNMNSAELELDTNIDVPFHGTAEWLNAGGLVMTTEIDHGTTVGHAAAAHIGTDDISQTDADSSADNNLSADNDSSANNNLPADLKRTEAFIRAHQNYGMSITIPAGTTLTEPVFLNFTLDDESPVLIDYLQIHAEADSHAEIVVTYRSQTGKSCFHGGFAAIRTEPRANVRLTRIQMLSDRDIHLDAAGVTVAADSTGDILFCELGGSQTIGSCNTSLTGTNSRGNIDCLYLGSQNSRQDFNYRMEMRGPQSTGEVDIKGALTGSARKVLKSTLDFISGCAGSNGREEETVLTLSDRVVNLSAPLLLCGEDNVEGAHATNTGKPDEGKLYYLMSRGFSEKEAKQLLVEASFTPLLNKLPSDSLREDVLKRIREVIHDER